MQLTTLFFGVGLICVLLMSCNQIKSVKKSHYVPSNITGVWNVDSVKFKSEKRNTFKPRGVYFKFSSNEIYIKEIKDSIGLCIFYSIEKPNTVSLLVYFSMYEKKYPFIYQVNSKEAIEYFKEKQCKNLNFKSLNFKNENYLNDDLESLFIKLTNTYEYSLKSEQLIMNSNSLCIYLSATPN